MAGTDRTRKTVSEIEQVVVFKLGEEEYGVNVTFVKEIDRVQAITRVPRAPDFLEGVINLRGHIIAIIDLRKRFALEPKAYDKKTRIMVLEFADILVGIVVDSVQDVVRVPVEDIEATPEVVAQQLEGNFLKGVAKLDERLVMLLDVQDLLTKKEIETLEGLEHRDGQKGKATATVGGGGSKGGTGGSSGQGKP